MGEGIKMALKISARPYANWWSCHACEWDISAKTVREYNAACGNQSCNPAILDGRKTEDIISPKSNWDLPINKPTNIAFITTTKITFTFGGLQIDTTGEAQDMAEQSIPGLSAAGELVGRIFFANATLAIRTSQADSIRDAFLAIDRNGNASLKATLRPAG